MRISGRAGRAKTLRKIDGIADVPARKTLRKIEKLKDAGSDRGLKM